MPLFQGIPGEEEQRQQIVSEYHTERVESRTTYLKSKHILTNFIVMFKPNIQRDAYFVNVKSQTFFKFTRPLVTSSSQYYIENVLLKNQHYGINLRRVCVFLFNRKHERLQYLQLDTFFLLLYIDTVVCMDLVYSVVKSSEKGRDVFYYNIRTQFL